MKKILLLILMLAISLSLLFSCKKKDKDDGGSVNDTGIEQDGGDTQTPDGGGTPDSGAPGTDNPGGTTTPDTGDSDSGSAGGDTPSVDIPTGEVIFSSQVETAVICNGLGDESSDISNLVMSVVRAIQDETRQFVDYNVDSGSYDHEIVFGESNRAVTAKAEELLDRRIKREASLSGDENFALTDLVGYAVYSEGGSVAVVWTDFHIRDMAFEFFIDSYILGDSLHLKNGYIKTEVFSLSEYLEERGERIKEEKWRLLEEALGSYGPKIVEELKTLYTLYTSDMVLWMADLYDPELGAWYSSASARDYEGASSLLYNAKTVEVWEGGLVDFGPSIESTWSGIAFADKSGMAEWFDGDWTAAMPDEIKDKVISWLQSLQNPDDGFFYHPQWPKEKIIAGGWQSRLTRDRNSATSVLKLLGSKPLYASYSSDVPLVGNLGVSTVSAVSRVVLAADSMLPQFESLDKFKEYVAGMEAKLEGMTDKEIAYQFYAYGNEFQSLVKELNENPDMKAVLVDFFNRHQNPKNGTWSQELYYDSASCIHKIGDLYNRIDEEIQYVDEAIESVITILNFDVQEYPATWGVDIYNTWSVFPYIYTNIRNHAEGTLEQKEEKIQTYVNKVYENAPAMIRNSFAQISRFRYDNGAFGYYPAGHVSGAYSQGIPSSLPGVAEPGVDGNGIASGSLVNCIFGALEMEDYFVPYFTEAERMIYVNRLLELGAIVKNPYAEPGNKVELQEDMTYDFEDVSVGELPDGVKAVLNTEAYNPIPGTYAYVQQDGKNKVLEVVAKHRGDDELGRNYSVGTSFRVIEENDNCAIIEMDIKFDSSACSKGLSSLIEFSVSYESTPVLYPTFRMSDDNKIWLYGWDKNPIVCIGNADEYIDLRIEYYPAEGVYKIYVDDMYRASATDCYTPGGTHRKVNGVGFSTASTNTARYFIDNLRCVRVNKTYVEGERELLPEKTYTFNSGMMPSGIFAQGDIGGYEVIKDTESGTGYLSVTNVESADGGNNPTFSLSPYLRTYIYNAVLASFDIAVPDVRDNSVDSTVSRVNAINSDGEIIWQMDIGVNSEGKLYFENERCLGTRVQTDIDASLMTSIKMLYFSGVGVGKCDDIMLIYIGEENDPVAYTFTPYQSVGSNTDIALLSFGAPASGNGGLTVHYDNLRLEKTIAQYTSPVTYPERTPGEDSETLDFEDYSVGSTLPDRITGDGVIGAELDDSNRFLQLIDASKTDSGSILVKLYEKEGENNNNTLISFTAEYLTADIGKLHSFTLIDKDGNEETIFYISKVAYGSVSAIRPYTHNTGAGWNFTDEGLYSVVMDVNSNVITREAYKAEQFTGNYTPVTKVEIRIVVDWHKQTVSVYFNEKYNNLCKGENTTVYTMSLRNVDSFRIDSYEATTSVLCIDDLTTRNYYTTPPTPNTSADHGFDAPADTPIVDYIENGVNVIPNGGSFEYGGYESAGDDGYLLVDGSMGNPNVMIPSFTQDRTNPNSAVVELDIELFDLAKEKSVAISLLGEKNKAFFSLALRENSDGLVELVQYNSAFTKEIRVLDACSASRLNVKIEYFSENGYVVVTLSTPDGQSEFYILVLDYNDAFTGISLSVLGETGASFRLYSARVESIYVDLSLPMGDDKTYDFEDGTIPDDIVVSGTAPEASGGILKAFSDTLMLIPANIRTYNATASIVDMKIRADASTADLFELSFEAINGKSVWKVTVSVNEQGEIVLYDPVCLPTPVSTGVLISDSDFASLRFEHYWYAGDGMCEIVLKAYINGSSSPVAVATRTYVTPFNYEQAMLKTLSVSVNSAVELDELSVENIEKDYVAEPVPDVAPGEDKPTVDFEDSNVGATLPERFEGDAAVSTELDGSNRYLFLENTDGSGSLIIRPFGEREGASTLEFEFDVEYLYKAEINKNLHTFVLVSEDGSETPLFNLLNMHTGAGWAVRATTAKGAYISGGPNVISRQQILSGKLSGNGGDMSKTVVKIILDLESGVVTATFRGTRPDDTFTVTAVTDAVALKIVNGECQSALAIDNVRAEYVYPIPEYNLGFMVDGEEYYNVITEHNALLTLPESPEKDGYIFEGWYFDEGVWSEPLYADTLVNSPLTADTVVYARFTEIPKFTVTFVVDGEEYETLVTEYNSVITLPTAPDKEGYTFEGWYFDEGAWREALSEDSFIVSPLDRDVLVYAYFKEIPPVKPDEPTTNPDSDAPLHSDVIEDAWTEGIARRK